MVSFTQPKHLRYENLRFFFTLFYRCFSHSANPEVEYEVTKTYDEAGNLIRYDSVRKEKNNWVKSHYSFSYNQKNVDSLLQGLAFIGEGNDLFIKDSLKMKLDDFLKTNESVFWVNGDKIEIHTEDLLPSMFFIDAKKRTQKQDSLLEKKLRNQIKRLQKKLDEIEKRKNTP